MNNQQKSIKNSNENLTLYDNHYYVFKVFKFTNEFVAKVYSGKEIFGTFFQKSVKS